MTVTNHMGNKTFYKGRGPDSRQGNPQDRIALPAIGNICKPENDLGEIEKLKSVVMF